jgi:predicted RNase H-like nuclease (RuvC/YqgF family)
MFSTVLHPTPDTPSEETEVIVSAVDETPIQEEIVNDPEEITHALAAIQKFRDVSDETEVAVMMVGDRLKAISAERDDLQRQLGVKDEEIVQLRSQLEAAGRVADEKTGLLKKNEQLEAEVRKLRTTLDQFENLIKGVKQK